MQGCKQFGDGQDTRCRFHAFGVVSAAIVQRKGRLLAFGCSDPTSIEETRLKEELRRTRLATGQLRTHGLLAPSHAAASGGCQGGDLLQRLDIVLTRHLREQRVLAGSKGSDDVL